MTSLQSLGLTKNEEKVYIALVRLRSAAVSEIAREANVPRVNCYDVLESLRAKGLVATIAKSNKKYYEPADPKRLNGLLAEKQASLQAAKAEIQGLSLLFQADSTKKDIGLFRDKLGVRSVLKDVLGAKEEVLNFGSAGLFPKHFPEYFSIWEARRVKKRIPMRIVAANDLKGKIPRKKLQSVRFLKTDQKNLTSTFVYGDKVALFMWTAEPFAILIENAELASSYKGYFEYLWREGKK